MNLKKTVCGALTCALFTTAVMAQEAEKAENAEDERPVYDGGASEMESEVVGDAPFGSEADCVDWVGIADVAFRHVARRVVKRDFD